MTLYKIPHRATGSVLFECEADSLRLAVQMAVRAKVSLYSAGLDGANLYGADLHGADLRWASLCGANLCGADLLGANLLEADLRGASLREARLAGVDLAFVNFFGADLSGVDWGEGAKWDDEVIVTRPPIMIHGLAYPVVILDFHAEICSEIHTIEEWSTFDRDEISVMGGVRAVEFWRAHKEPLLALAKAAGRPIDPVPPAPEVEEQDDDP